MALIQDLTPTQIAQAAGLQPAEIEALRPSIVVTMGRKPETWLRDHEALGWEKPTGRAPGFSWGTGRFWIGLRPARDLRCTGPEAWSRTIAVTLSKRCLSLVSINCTGHSVRRNSSG